MEEIEEDFDVVSVSYESSTGKSNLNDNKINEVKKAVALIFQTIKNKCPDAILQHSVQHDDDDIYLKVKITTDSGDWVEADNKTFADYIQYASEFKITPIGDEQMEINFLFDNFIKIGGNYMMSYEEYLNATKEKDSRQNWIAWKVEVYGMEPAEATKAAYDSEWGYKPLPKK